MVSEKTSLLQAPHERLSQLQERFRLSPSPCRAQFLQIICEEGAGGRRIALSLLKPAKEVVWMSPRWNLYAPVLWKMASKHQMRLLGIECPERKRWRLLWHELLESRVFDAWVLDSFSLNAGEGRFLQNMARRFPLRILVLDRKPHSFCLDRATLHLNHQKLCLSWSKGQKPEWQETSSLFQFLEKESFPSFGASPCLP